MKRTYGGRRGTGTGALDYRELLQSVDSTSTVFDALSIKNLKQLKRDTSSSYQTWYNQRTARKRAVNRVRKRESPLTSDHDCASPPVESCLTPDKSLRVNRAPDSFDQLWECHGNESLHVRKDIDLFDQLLSSTPDNSLKYQNIASDPNLNLSSEKSPNILKNHSRKNNTNYNESILHGSSDLHKYNLMVEGQKQDKILSNSIKNVVNNASFLRAIVNRSLSKTTATEPRRSNIKNHNSTPIKQIEPLTSTPYMKKKYDKYSMNVSPIQRKGIKPPKISVVAATTVCESHSHNSIINERDSSNICEEITHADISHESEDVIISKRNFETSITSNKMENTNNSIISVHSDFTGEAFLGFSNVPGPHSSQELNGKDLINCIDNIIDNIAKSDDYSKNENVLPVTSSTESPNSSLSFDSANKNSNSSNDSQSCTSTSLYNTICSTDKSIQQELEDYKHAEPRVCIERLRDSLFLKHYQFTKTYVCSDSSNEGRMQHLSNNEDLDQQTVTSHVPKTGLNGMFKEGNVDRELETSKSSKGETSYSSQGSDNDARTSCTIDRKSSNKISSLKANYSAFKANVGEVRESISISSESNCSTSENSSFSSESAENSNSSTNLSPSKRYQRTKIKNTAQGMTSFVTTRRRNVMDESVLILLDDSFNTSALASNSNMIDVFDPQDTGTESKSAVDTSNKFRESLLIVGQSEIKTELGLIAQKESQCIFNKSNDTTRSSLYESGEGVKQDSNPLVHLMRQSIVLQPGKKWERSLSLYRRQTISQNHPVYEETIQENVSPNKSKYNEIQLHQYEQNKKGTAFSNDSVCGQKTSLLRNIRRSTIRVVKEAAAIRASFSASPLLDDIGFLSEDCDDTLAELSKLSISDSALDVTVLEKRPGERLTSARDVVLRRCNQTDVLPFHECYPDSVLKNCRKIGEGVYGEVFLYRGQDGRGRVMKVVPVEGALLVNGEHQKTFQEVISEVVIAMELSALRAPIEDIERHCDDERDNSGLDLSSVENATDTFNEVLAVRCVYGAYPARLLDLWELYDESKGSENDNPVVLPPDQLYMVLELANAGQDLESYQFNSAEQAYALFYQVAFALAVGEEAYQLEHRDLHWGNVLIQPTDQKFARYVLHGRMHSVPRCGVAATIIDYTLSRVTLPIAGGEQATVYNDLGADEGLFHAVGDYQFDIYRHMREKTGNDWKKFEPYTNVLWLHYTVDKMITALRYKRTNTKIHKHYIAKLKGIRNCLLDYTSAAHFVLADTQI